MSTTEGKTASQQDVDGLEKGSPISGAHIDERILKHSYDADEALKAIQQANGEVITIDEATNKRLVRIIDWHLMPLMCIVYGMNYLDSMFFAKAVLVTSSRPDIIQKRLYHMQVSWG